MSDWNRTRRALAVLLPAGILGASTLLGSAQATVLPASRVASDPADVTLNVADRLAAIREGVAGETEDTRPIRGTAYPLLAWMNFGGFGWRNGGWRNGGWRNWGNGWHNWGNGWHNWGNGGWHNFWHNW
jgi:rSAM-associated Gly-rich repeat protein